MKNFNIYHAIAPVIALFAVGCSSPVAMQSTEYDDMYYSSSDRTEYVQPQAQATEQQYAPTGESTQSAQSATGDVTEDYYADEYYDGRTYRPQATWNTPNYAYVDPYWTTAHVRRMNRYNAFHDPFFYDPFMSSYYDPFMYDPFFSRRGGMMVSINMSYGWGSGWNRWGHPYGMYDPFWGNRWWPHNNYYAGFYHGYNHGYYGGNRFIYDRPVVVQPRQVQYGPREGRSGVPVTGNPDRVTGRPARTQSVTDEQRATQSVDYARPSRTGRTTGTGEIRGEQSRQVEGRQALPARPSRRQPANQQPVQRINPAREGGVQPAQRQQRIQQRPVQRQERIQPVQRTQPSYQRSQPVQRSQPSYQRSQPVQRSQPSYSPPTRSSGTSSPPARTNSSGGGRPTRGGN
ncbi:hypothetical protein [uncultured Pontibacter sp.]|uniref:hypothetical protein n=1 Tax=uncultured Pontibacter sp. TaxID=453356 RepID=UPI002628BC40|nr:hypothetical protein [uncultured Pontibacter sp.]